MHLFSTAKKLILNNIEKFSEQYVREKYGPRALLCVVGSEGNQLYAKWTLDEWNIPATFLPEHHKYIRKTCGQYTFTRYGLPQPDAEVPAVILLPLPSVMITLGFKEYIKFLKDWRGDTKVGSVTVVKYFLIGDKNA